MPAARSIAAWTWARLLAVASAMQGDGALARQTVGLLKDFNVASDFKRAKAMALARVRPTKPALLET